MVIDKTIVIYYIIFCDNLHFFFCILLSLKKKEKYIFSIHLKLVYIYIYKNIRSLLSVIIYIVPYSVHTIKVTSDKDTKLRMHVMQSTLFCLKTCGKKPFNSVVELFIDVFEFRLM